MDWSTKEAVAEENLDLKLSGSQKILKEIKNTVKGDYYKKFIKDLEDLIGDSVETPFQCTW